jgi:hypothetical protein
VSELAHTLLPPHGTPEGMAFRFAVPSMITRWPHPSNADTPKITNDLNTNSYLHRTRPRR